MSLSLRIALRYLLSRKSHGAVNVISAISVAAVAVSAAAMIIVLSVFNGFSSLASQKLSKLDPDFMLTPTTGKSLEGADSICTLLRRIPAVAYAEPEITEQAFAVAGERQMGVMIKGMTDRGLKASSLRDAIIDGAGAFHGSFLDTELDTISYTGALLSVGTAMGLNLRPTHGLCDFTIYEPRRQGRINPANPMGAFRMRPMRAKGVYQIEQEEYDRNMILLPYDAAAELLSYDDAATSIAVTAAGGADTKKIEKTLTETVAPLGLEVKDRYHQQEQAFRMIAIEKWITFLMLGFILIISSFNIVSTLSMMMIEKDENMNIIKAMGGTRNFINHIFINQGWLIVILGGTAGLVAGAVLVLCQQHFGWIKLNAADPTLMAVDAYPVLLEPSDLIVTFLSILAVALLITPAILLLRRK